MVGESEDNSMLSEYQDKILMLYDQIPVHSWNSIMPTALSLPAFNYVLK